MKIGVLYNEPEANASTADLDVLVQVDVVSHALIKLGHEPIKLGCTLDLATLRRDLIALKPDHVFNLVESLAGVDRLMPLATLLLDTLSIPYTGTQTHGMLLANDKLAAKAKMRELGIPTADWFCADSCRCDHQGPMIVKAVWEHASWGMDDQAIVSNLTQAKKLLAERTQSSGRLHFAEAFIAGREFNLSLLAAPNSTSLLGAPQVLPVAEIDFSGLPTGKPKIVGYAAKWDEDSTEYAQTPRRFLDPGEDPELVKKLRQIACECWHAFGISGYARVDFRVDEAGNPWVLEVNANPCLSPDAGFAAALAQASIPFETAISRILADFRWPHQGLESAFSARGS